MCTSFAAYYDKPIYGMNLDYPEAEIILKIEKSGLIKYLCFYVKVDGAYYPFAGVNEKGKFVNFQEMHLNSVNEVSEKAKVVNKIDAQGLFFSYLREHISIDQILSIGSDTRLLYPKLFKVHNMFADLHGRAVILECINGRAVQRKIHGKQIVMTNFSNFLHADHKQINVDCLGADRYFIVEHMVKQAKDLLDMHHAVDILRSAFQTNGHYQTRCSLICMPLKNEVYMIINRKIDHIWRISLAKETLEHINQQNWQNVMTIQHDGMIINKLETVAGCT